MIPIPYIYPIYMAGIDLTIMPILKATYLGFLNSSWSIPLTMALYSMQPLLFYYGLTFESMGILNVLWNTISTILVAVAGVYFFNEKINYIQGLGITLCISGIMLLGLK